MRIKVSDTAQKVLFMAYVDTDYVTAKTGLSSFTVYYSLNGGAATAMTTPTVAEIDATNMAGLYVLTVDEAGMVSAKGELVVYPAASGGYISPKTIEIVDNFEKDAYDIVNNGTYGNSALKTEIDANETKIDTVDTNVDTLITRVPAEVAQKAHLVNGTGDITPSTNKGIWDALGDGTKSVSGLNDISTANVNTEVDNALNTAIPGTPTSGSVNEELKKIRKVVYNRVEVVIESNVCKLKVYDDNGTSVLYTYTLTDADGNAITTTADLGDGPAKRGAPA